MLESERGIHNKPSWYPVEVTRKVDKYREQLSHAKDKYERWRAAYDALRLMLDNPTASDKEMMDRLGLDAIALSHRIASDFANDKVHSFFFPMRSRYQVTYQLSSAVIEHLKNHFQLINPPLDRILLHEEPRMLFIRHPEDLKEFERIDFFDTDARATAAKKLISEEKAVDFPETEFGEMWDRLSSPWSGMPKSKMRYVFESDKDQEGNDSNFRFSSEAVDLTKRR